jgi:tetratricopeptide (TPR) repeat protein
MTDVISLARLSADATAILQVCAMLDPDCIQERLFAAPPTSAKLLNGFPATLLQFADARAELLRSSMVHRNPDKQELWLHREVQESVRRQCSPESFDGAFRSAAALVRNAWDTPRQQVRDYARLWEPGAIFLRHAIQLQQIYVHYSGSNTGHSIGPSLDFAWLLAESASYHINLSSTVGLKNTLDLALLVCEQLPTRSTFDLRSDIYHNLGAWANETNHAQECFDYNKRYLDMRCEAVSAGADPTERTAAAWNQYGTGLMMVGRIEDAMDAFQASIDMYGIVRNETQCPDSLPIVNLAIAKWLAKDYDGAAKTLETGRLAREDAYGYDDVKTFRYGRYLHAHGNVCWDQGQWKDSRIWHKRALQQYIKSLGKASHRTADVRHRMAMHCLRERDHENAGKLIDQALESWKLDPKSFQQEIARTTWLKAQQRAMSGNPVEAAELREEATAMRARILGLTELTPSWSNLRNQDFDDLVAFWSR